MYFAIPIAHGATWHTNPQTGAAGAGHASAPLTMDPLPSIAYRALRKLMAESNWLAQAAPHIAALEASYEQIQLRRAASIAARDSPTRPTVFAHTCTPAITPGLMAAYGQLLSAVPRALQALRSPASALDSTVQPALTSLVQLRALGIAVADTPTAAAECPVTAVLGSATAVHVLSVPRVWPAVTGLRSDAAGREECRHCTDSPTATPVGRSVTVRSDRPCRLAPATTT